MACLLSPLYYTKHDFSIQESHQYYWCMSHLHFNGHIDIVHHENIWYLTDICRWLRRCKLTDCRGDTNFCHHRIMIQNTWLYIPHTLFYHWNCCVINIPRLHICWLIFLRPSVMRSDRKWVQEMRYRPLLWWRWPSWDCMMHPQHSPIFFLFLHQQIFQIFFVSSSLMIIHPLWPLLGWSIQCFLQSGIFSHNHCRWCGQSFFGGFLFLFCFTFIIPGLPCWVNISLFPTPWGWFCLLEL